jgi:hypothetical protein
MACTDPHCRCHCHQPEKGEAQRAEERLRREEQLRRASSPNIVRSGEEPLVK